MITSGATVLMIVNLDSGTGKAVIDKAKARACRSSTTTASPSAAALSTTCRFDNAAVGKLQGDGLVKCLTDKARKTRPVVAELNGSPTDNNATLFKQGYDSVLKPKFDATATPRAGDQSVPDWDNTKAGTIFEQMMTADR